LRPVNLSIAKDQHLSLNPAQISGPCGRLLCCLHYEHDFYVQSRKRFPKEGKVLRTAAGQEKVLAVDIFRDRVTLRSEDQGTRVVPLDQLQVEVERAAGDAPASTAPAPSAPVTPVSPTTPGSGSRRGEGRRRRRRKRPRDGGTTPGA
jgi:hypothetical protein